MKFSEMPYQRPDMEQIRTVAVQAEEALMHAASPEDAFAAVERFDHAMSKVSTMSNLSYIRHSINTKDEFYSGENDYFDEQSPLIEEMKQRVYRAILDCPQRQAMEARYGSLLFRNLEIAARSFRPELIPLMQEENKLTSAYEKLYASAMVEWNGEQIPLPMLGPYKESKDRDIRRAAFVKEGEFFDKNREELDMLYDKLVKVRNKQARLLGHKNYIQLGYDRLGRNCYGYNELKAFREQIAADMVPVISAVKQEQQKRIETDSITIYDTNFMFQDGNAMPQGSAEDILAAGKDMYHGLSPETAEFIDFMYDNQLFDVLSRDGKAPGGYCTELPDYQAPFIFSNFNGTSGDVDVLTHEAGHAFAGYRAMRKGLLSLEVSPTIEACEVHSMSMEFLTQDFHQNFFGTQTRKYELGHCIDALVFIPYGCMVDEFQHLMYEHEEYTPEDRNRVWLELEKKYRPYLSFDKIPFYARGAGWQRQLHIYLYPLYYIDYCMAQTVAFQFWIASMKNRDDAWKRYLKFVDLAGTVTFEQLVQAADMRVPYDKGCIKAIADEISQWISSHPL